jgi:subtilisin family serine protease
LPAAFDHVLCVGGATLATTLGQNGHSELSAVKAWESNFGFGVDVFAPDSGPAPTWNPSAPSVHNSYTNFSGTSAAAAFAAGVAALVHATGASNVETIAAMECSAIPLATSGPNLIYGHGEIDALRAIEAAARHESCADQPETIEQLINL